MAAGGNLLPATNTTGGNLLPVRQIINENLLPATRQRHGAAADAVAAASQNRPPASAPPLSAKARALRAVLEGYGINWNWKTAQLAQKPWVTAGYIAAHVQARPDNLGLAISLMLQQAPPPKQPASGWKESYYDDLVFD
jgi:hypothetical protein